VRAFAIAAAITLSCEGSAAAAFLSSARAGVSGQRLTVRSGELSSGSDKRTSKTITAAPAARRRSIIPAITVRGQGNWPIRFSEASSMATMRTGDLATSNSRGFRR